MKQYDDKNVGLNSVQWVDAQSVNKLGYPKENCLNGCDFKTPPSAKGGCLLPRTWRRPCSLTGCCFS